MWVVFGLFLFMIALLFGERIFISIVTKTYKPKVENITEFKGILTLKIGKHYYLYNSESKKIKHRTSRKFVHIDEKIDYLKLHLSATDVHEYIRLVSIRKQIK